MNDSIILPPKGYENIEPLLKVYRPDGHFESYILRHFYEDGHYFEFTNQSFYVDDNLELKFIETDWQWQPVVTVSQSGVKKIHDFILKHFVVEMPESSEHRDLENLLYTGFIDGQHYYWLVDSMNVVDDLIFNTIETLINSNLQSEE